MFEVLSAQQRTNQKLEEQFHRANETQEYQAEAMQDMAQANFQMKFDHMFAGVPMYDGTDPDIKRGEDIFAGAAKKMFL